MWVSLIVVVGLLVGTFGPCTATSSSSCSLCAGSCLLSSLLQCDCPGNTCAGQGQSSQTSDPSPSSLLSGVLQKAKGYDVRISHTSLQSYSVILHLAAPRDGDSDEKDCSNETTVDFPKECNLTSEQLTICQKAENLCPPTDDKLSDLQCELTKTQNKYLIIKENIDCQSCIGTTVPPTPESTTASTKSWTTTTATTSSTTTTKSPCPVLSARDTYNCYYSTLDFTVCSDFFDSDLDPVYCVEKDKDFEQLTANVRCDCGNYTMFRTTTTTGLPTTKDPWTTAPVSTTAGTTNKCLYTMSRPAQLPYVPLPRAKRLSLASSVFPDCQYPGIVTLFKGNGTTRPEVVGSGILLDANHTLISEYGKVKLDSSADSQFTVHISTYNFWSVDSGITIRTGTDIALDKSGRLFVVPLSSPVTLDSRCTLPACVPNDLITVDDLDLSDCRVVASGTYNDSDPANLLYREWVQEVRVKVVGSLDGPQLQVRRLDSQPNILCINDAGGSVICPLQATGEWVTVALADGHGSPCATGDTVMANRFFSLLPGTAPFAALQNYTQTASAVPTTTMMMMMGGGAD